MSRGTVVYGCCPVCLRPTPLIWDGTVRPHAAHELSDNDCPGSLHAPVVEEPKPTPEHAHVCRSCGVTFEETNQ